MGEAGDAGSMPARHWLRRPSRWFAAAAVAAGALVGFWPGTPVQAAGLLVPAALVVVVNLRAWRAQADHPVRASWLLLALGMALTLAGEVARLVDDLAWLPVGHLTIVANLAAYPFYLAMHLVRVWRLGGRHLSVAALLDTLICVLVVGAFGAQAFLPLVGSVPIDRLIGLAMPPLMTLAILLITGYLVYLSPRAPSPSALLLALVALLTTVANCLLALRTLHPVALSLVPLALVVLMVAFLSLTALPRLDRRATLAADQTGPLLSVVVRSMPLVLVAALALMVIDARLTGLSEPETLHLLYQRALAVCTLLILVRQWLMLRAKAALLRALQASNLALTQAHERAQREARTDVLTGLPNQRLLREYLETSLAYHRRTSLPLTLLFLDLDHFKDINDRFGHRAGDAALVEVGWRLRQSLRAGDIIARYGGEEFVVLLPSTDAVEGRAIAERLHQQIGGQPVALPGHHAASVTVSIGLATSRDVIHGAEGLLAAADAALYTAKQSGRDRVCQAAPMLAAD